MPYPNEHSARLRNPDDFDKETYRRTEGGTIFGKTKVPKTISIVWAKLKGKTKSSDPPLPQALRFPIKSWTESKAKAWLKTNKVKYVLFEAAKPKDKQSALENEAPPQACVLSSDMLENMTFAENKDKAGGFKIVGYSGGIIKHFYWGNLAIDLQGTKFYKKPLPVLESHFTDKRIGFSTNQTIDGNVTIEGKFLDNENAQSLRNDMEAGFPMEASLFCPPSVIERVAEGSSVKVNGLTLKGPGAVFRKSIIKEISMCVFGYDSNTKSSAFAGMENVKFNSIQENKIMSEQLNISEMNLDQLTQERPDLVNEIFEKAKVDGVAEGKKGVMDYFSEIKEACGGDAELIVQCFEENKTVKEASALKIDKLKAENEQLSKTNTELSQKQQTSETNKVDPALAEFNDEQQETTTTTDNKGSDDEKLEAEFNASSELQTEFGGDVKAYIAFKKAEANEQVRILATK